MQFVLIMLVIIVVCIVFIRLLTMNDRERVKLIEEWEKKELKKYNITEENTKIKIGNIGLNGSGSRFYYMIDKSLYYEKVSKKENSFIKIKVNDILEIEINTSYSTINNKDRQFTSISIITETGTYIVSINEFELMFDEYIKEKEKLKRLKAILENQKVQLEKN